MTIILSVLTRDFVMQACDRRLTMPGQSDPVEDDAIKAVLFHNFLVFSYTGLSKLPVCDRVDAERARRGDLEDTNMWLASVLHLEVSDLDRSIHTLQAELASSLGRARRSIQPPHPIAFFGVGWMNWEAGAPLEPAIVEVSNLADPREVREATIRLAESHDVFSHASSPLPRAIHADLDDLLRRCMRRAPVPAAMARVLVDTIRRLADVRDNVGKGVLINCLPRDQVARSMAGHGWEMRAGPPDLDHVSFLYFPPGEGDGIHHGPTISGSIVLRELGLGPEVSEVQFRDQPPSS